jgi:MoaA/NifB/PqqE/SkfB family radical SAM enzyme
LYVCWEITTRCNLSCDFCYAFKELPDESFEKMLRIADSLVSNKVRVVNITGGEPFLHPELMNVVDYCHKQHLKIVISTNGMFLNKDTLSALASKVQFIGVSLDTLVDRDAKLLRGKTYALKKVLASIVLTSSSRIGLKVNTIVTKYNRNALHKVAEFIESLDCQNMTWKLYELTINNNVSEKGQYLMIPHNQFTNLVKELRSKHRCLRIVDSESDTMNSAYIIVTPNGSVHVPNKNGFRSLGNLLELPLVDILDQANFDFKLNEKVMAYI